MKVVNNIFWIINLLLLGNIISLTSHVDAQNTSSVLPSIERKDVYLPPTTIEFQIDSLIAKMHKDINNSILILKPTNYTEAEHVSNILNDMNSTLNLIDRKISNYIWQVSNEGH